MVQVASEGGVGNATVARVVARSGVSRRTFYELFEDREECFLAAFDEVVRRIERVVVPAYEQADSWRAGIRAALAALLQFIEAEPGLGRIAIVETLGAGPRALARRRQTLARVIGVVDRGRDASRDDGPPPLTAEGIVGGAFSLIHSRLLGDGEGNLLELLNPLMSMIVLPYLGTAVARRELSQPSPESSNGTTPPGMDPLRDLEMRLTYRTIRVLLAIGAPGGQGHYPSNRQVADAAGIRDQGQVSKLLARLTQIGLVENAAEPQAKGEPNAWKLTERGAKVREVISA